MTYIADLILPSVHAPKVVLVVWSGGMENICNVKDNGISIKFIAREINTSRNNVRKYLKSEPNGKEIRNRGSKMVPYKEKTRALIEGNNLSGVRIRLWINKLLRILKRDYDLKRTFGRG